MPAHLASYLIMLPLLAWIVWRRASRTFGRQQVQRKRMIARVVLFSIIGAALALSGFHQLALAEGLLGGVLIGGAIGLVGLRLTRFEIDPVKGDCYVPNVWIGALLMVLLLGRLAWRLMAIWPQLQHGFAAANAASGAGGQPMGSPSSVLTMLVIGLLVGYYIVYYSGVLIHHRRFQRSHPQTTLA